MYMLGVLVVEAWVDMVLLRLEFLVEMVVEEELTLKKKAYSVTPSTGYTVSVGAGGTAGSSSGGTGGNGGDTYFNTTGVLLAKGGKGGGNPDGAGGADSSGVGDIKYSGGQGSYGAEAEIGIGGGAAGTVYAGSFTTQGEFIGGAGGNPGAVPGGGGNGGANNTQAGKVGGNGKVYIHYATPSADSDNFFMMF